MLRLCGKGGGGEDNKESFSFSVSPSLLSLTQIPLEAPQFINDKGNSTSEASQPKD